MAATRRRELCWYCRSELSGAHRAGCPLVGPIGPLSEQAITEWNGGYALGHNDSRDEDDAHVFSRDVQRRHSPAFIRGYNLGSYECERAVCATLNDDYYEDPDEGYEYVTVYKFR